MCTKRFGTDLDLCGHLVNAAESADFVNVFGPFFVFIIIIIIVIIIIIIDMFNVA